MNTLQPPEMLCHVFGLLPPEDLKNVVLVCRLWREVGEEPELWSWVIFRVSRGNLSTMPHPCPKGRNLSAETRPKFCFWESLSVSEISIL